MPLAFLTRLESLSLSWEGEQASTAHVDLPATLTQLCIGGKVQTGGVPAGICHMVLIDPALCTGVVEALPALDSLSTLKLRFRMSSPENVESLAPVVSLLTALSCLSRVHICNGFERLSASTCKSAGFGRALAQLSSLRKVKFNEWELDATDALHLSALTQLTKLHVYGGGSGFDDVVVSSLAVCLTDLVILDIHFCGLDTQAVFPVLAKLPRLRDLSLWGDDGTVDDMGLMRFASSTTLTKIELPQANEVTEEGKLQFHEATRSTKPRKWTCSSSEGGCGKPNEPCWLLSGVSRCGLDHATVNWSWLQSAHRVSVLCEFWFEERL
jgi:hypothetical protein